MSIINVLDNNTINLIAAGEVVERPGSVVKELVENAMDSGANAITVEIKQGGIEFIRVTDNGSGIYKDDIKLAFKRHATSKIKKAEDILFVASMGFRGEALSSISSVAKVELITKRHEELIGFHYEINAGESSDIEEIGAPDGTTIIVRNLFYNIPARRKFLKSESSEANNIRDIMEHLALARPEISFNFIVNGKTKFQTTGSSDIKEIIYRLYGKEIKNEMIPIDYDINDIKITGYLGKPSINRSNRNFETYFINKRYIQSKEISTGIEEGYREFLMQHKFPFCVLHINMDFSDVDVNVHPAKLQVKFLNNCNIHDMIAKAVGDTLFKVEMIPGVSLSTENELKDTCTNKSPEIFENVRRNLNFDITSNTIKSSIKNNISDNLNISSSNNQIYMNKTQDNLNNSDSLSQNPTHGNLFTLDFEEDDLAENFDKSYLSDIKNHNNSELIYEEISDYSYTNNEELNKKELNKEELNKEEENKEEENKEENKEDSNKEDSNKEDQNIEEGNKKDKNPSTLNSKKVYFNASNINTLNPNFEEYNEPKEEIKEKSKEELKEEFIEELKEEFISEQTATDNLSVPNNSISINENNNNYENDKNHLKPVQLSFYEEEKFLSKNARRKYRIIGQVFNTYWIIEYGKNIFFVDQHAAHEKVNYEKIMKRIKNEKNYTQYINPPIVLSLSANESDCLDNNKVYLEKIGFEWDDMGGSEIALTGIPGELYFNKPENLFMDILEELSVSKVKGLPEVILEKIATMACKASIKGGNEISLSEINVLLDELLTLDNPYNCPHGRPTIFSISQTELEKKFKRIVD